MLDDSPDVREAALRKWHEEGKRGFQLATIGQRLKALGKMGWRKRGVKVLEDKWKGLYVVDLATGFSGEIDCFMWNGENSQVALCSAHGHEHPVRYHVPEIPAMVWAARHEQPAHVILEGDPDAVDEFDVPGDGEAEELRRLAESDDEEDEMDTT